MKQPKQKLQEFRVWHLTKFGIGTVVVKGADAKDAKVRFKVKNKRFKVLSVDKICL
jgi:hypothetical protein